MASGSGDLDAAIEALAAELAPGLVAEAREAAVAEARGELARRLTDALLRQCGEELLRGGERPPPVGRAPRREAAPEPPPAAPEPPATAPHPLAEHARREATGHYVYGVVPAGGPAALDLVGVEPTAGVERIEENGIAALVSEVPLAEFDEGALRENLDDVAWLEEKARAHEGVLEAALADGAVVPLRLCTVFAGEDQVRAMLAREHEVLVDALERLDGRAEWGVKAYADPDAVEVEAPARAGEEVEEIADEWGRAIHGRLAAIASEALLNPLQRPELSGHDGEMVLNGVYLVADAEAPAFRAAVGALATEFERRGVAVELTGPWPAYNFVGSSIEAAR